MALIGSNRYGQSYRFGFGASDAPSLGGVVCRAAEVRSEAEVFITATNEDAEVVAIAMSPAVKRKLTATFSGYCLEGFSQASVPNQISFLGRTFFVRGVGDPRRKGEFSEVTIEAESYANVY